MTQSARGAEPQRPIRGLWIHVRTMGSARFSGLGVSLAVPGDGKVVVMVCCDKEMVCGGVGGEFFQGLQLGVGVLTVQGVGSGEFALWLFRTHQSKLLIQAQARHPGSALLE